MTLQDYLMVLRRHVPVWLGVTAACLLVALAVIQFSPRVYQATAGVFVSSTLEGTSGSQFVNQRVQSYPDIAASLAVLGPVIEELELDVSFRDLRASVAADNPVDTSQIDIVVTSSSGEQAAAIANAVAGTFGEVVEELETPQSGSSPVSLTVTDPATVPESPVSPDALLLLALGGVVGLSLGLASAVLVSRRDTSVHTEEELRRAWGADASEVPVHAVPRGRRRSAVSRPAALLGDQLELMAEDRPVHVVGVPASGTDGDRVTGLWDGVAAELTSRGVSAGLAGSSRDRAPDAAAPRVLMHVSAPPVALAGWRRLGAAHDGVVVVAERGRTTVAEVLALRTRLSAAGIAPLALVLDRSRRRSRRTGASGRSSQDLAPRTAGQPAGAALPSRAVGVPAPSGSGAPVAG